MYIISLMLNVSWPQRLGGCAVTQNAARLLQTHVHVGGTLTEPGQPSAAMCRRV